MGENKNKSDFISKHELLEKLHTLEPLNNGDVPGWVWAAIEGLNDSIVRCKDCAMYDRHRHQCEYIVELIECPHCGKNIYEAACDMPIHGFCYYGRRKI